MYKATACQQIAFQVAPYAIGTYLFLDILILVVIRQSCPFLIRDLFPAWSQKRFRRDSSLRHDIYDDAIRMSKLDGDFERNKK